MKKFLFLASIGMLMTSCSMKNYIQVVDIKSNSLSEEMNKYVYKDNNCKITYDFWAESGEAGFTIENLSDKMLYVNLAKSFYKKNGMARDYFLNRTFGLDRTLGAGVTYKEKEVIAVPPYSSKSISEYKIASELLEDCSVRMFPKRHHASVKKYSETESPVKFENYISYKVGEYGEDIIVNNKFYVTAFSNFNIKDVEEDIKVGCNEVHSEKFNRQANGTKYYIKYNNNHINIWSADAKSSQF